MKVALSVIVVILLLGSIIFFVKSNNSSKNNTQVIDKDESLAGVAKTEETDKDNNMVLKKYVTNLQDVTQGKIYRFTQFSGNSSGQVNVVYTLEDGYVLDAVFTNLPDPANDHFYEGWVVTSGENIDVVSTGKAVLNENGQYVNSFSSDQDLTNHTLYVLTIEPEDGDPKPEEHILEGILVLQN